MKLVLDITTEAQKQNVIELAQQMNIAVEVLEVTEAEDDAALVRSIYANDKNDILSPEETADFLKCLAK